MLGWLTEVDECSSNCTFFCSRSFLTDSAKILNVDLRGNSAELEICLEGLLVGISTLSVCFCVEFIIIN